jgi:hypothetical protein
MALDIVYTSMSHTEHQTNLFPLSLAVINLGRVQFNLNLPCIPFDIFIAGGETSVSPSASFSRL